MEGLALWLETNGYAHASTVRDVSDYTSRGGILDLSARAPAPVRLDFFGDTLKSIRTFDPETQRSVGQLRSLDLVPMSEALLTTNSIRRFRQLYAQEFGAPSRRQFALRRGQRRPAGDRPRALAAASLRPPRHAIRLRRRRALRQTPAARRRPPSGSPRSPTPTARAGAAYSRDPARPIASRCRRRASTRREKWKERLEAGALARLTQPLDHPAGAATIVDCSGRVGRTSPPSGGRGRQRVRRHGRPASATSAARAPRRSSPAGATARANG